MAKCKVIGLESYSFKSKDGDTIQVRAASCTKPMDMERGTGTKAMTYKFARDFDMATIKIGESYDFCFDKYERITAAY